MYLEFCEFHHPDLGGLHELVHVLCGAFPHGVVADLQAGVEGLYGAALDHHVIPAFLLDHLLQVHLGQVLKLLLLADLRRKDNKVNILKLLFRDLMKKDNKVKILKLLLADLGKKTVINA